MLFPFAHNRCHCFVTQATVPPPEAQKVVVRARTHITAIALDTVHSVQYVCQKQFYF